MRSRGRLNQDIWTKFKVCESWAQRKRWLTMTSLAGEWHVRYWRKSMVDNVKRINSVNNATTMKLAEKFKKPFLHTYEFGNIFICSGSRFRRCDGHKRGNIFINKFFINIKLSCGGTDYGTTPQNFHINFYKPQQQHHNQRHLSRVTTSNYTDSRLLNIPNSK